MASLGLPPLIKMGELFNAERLIASEEKLCIVCNNTKNQYGECIRCKAKDCSMKSTLVVAIENSDGDIVSVEERWVH